jgi:hypothetical protein
VGDFLATSGTVPPPFAQGDGDEYATVAEIELS